MPCAPAGVPATLDRRSGAMMAKSPFSCCPSRSRRPPPRARDDPGAALFLRLAADLFIEDYCIRCHNDQDLKGSLDLMDLDYKPGDPANFLTWVKAIRN